MCTTTMNGEKCPFIYEEPEDYCDECYETLHESL